MFGTQFPDGNYGAKVSAVWQQDSRFTNREMAYKYQWKTRLNQVEMFSLELLYFWWPRLIIWSESGSFTAVARPCFLLDYYHKLISFFHLLCIYISRCYISYSCTMFNYRLFSFFLLASIFSDISYFNLSFIVYLSQVRERCPKCPARPKARTDCATLTRHRPKALYPLLQPRAAGWVIVLGVKRIS